MKDLPFIPYNTSLKDFGRANRNQKNMTKSEWLMWNLALKWDRLGYRFLRQKIIGSFILDFFCSKLKLGIEIDGWYHNETQDYDEVRDDKLSEYWIKVIRYTSHDIEKNLDWVIQDLKERIKERELGVKTTWKALN